MAEDELKGRSVRNDAQLRVEESLSQLEGRKHLLAAKDWALTVCKITTILML